MKKSSFSFVAVITAGVCLQLFSGSASALLMEGIFQGQVSSFYSRGEASDALDALGIQIGDPVDVVFQYESTQFVDTYEDPYIGFYLAQPAAGELNWMKTTIGEHVWLSSPEADFQVYVLDSYKYGSDFFIDSLSFGAYHDFISFPGMIGDQWHSSTQVVFEDVDTEVNLTSSQDLPIWEYSFSQEIDDHYGEIYWQSFSPASNYFSLKYDIDLATASLKPAPKPIPEPATILLLGSGLISLAWYARKRKRA